MFRLQQFCARHVGNDKDDHLVCLDQRRKGHRNFRRLFSRVFCVTCDSPHDRCDGLDRLKQKCSTLEQEIRDPVKFKDFYQFTFNYAKNPGQKGLGEPIEMCR